MTELADSPPIDEGTALIATWLRTRDRRDRNEVVHHFAGLAHHIARRYERRPDGEDVHQVALIGLVKAVERFDPSFGVPFSAYAGTTIEGELKRYRRDHGWTVRVPRSAKELRAAVQGARRELEQQLRRSPTVDELAQRLSIERDDVLRALAADAAFEVASTDTPLGAGQRTALRADGGFDAVVDQETVRALMDQLPERERSLVQACFLEGRSQAQAAAEHGISQMHVSRLLRRAIEMMRSAAREP